MQKLLLQKLVSNMTIPKQTFLKKTLLASLFCSGFLLANDAQAQLSGPKAIPGDYATISAAVTAVNTAGVGTGGVTFNIAAGHTETGTNLALTATGTAANPIIFQKSGTGANPKITSGAGASTTLDGIFKLSGSDYVTIDGIDLLDAPGNTTATTRMEFGYALMRVSNTNGCQFVTIKNCNIQLNKAHNTSTAASIGIFSANHTLASTTALSSTGATAAGTNSNNKFFSNTISNIANGIRLEGISGLFDENNEVGVGGGNTFSDFGSGTTAQYIIYSIYQDNYKVANNNINGGGGTGIIYGIYATTAVNANTEIFNNTVSISTAATSNAVYGIANASGGTGTNNLVKIYNNTVQNINQSASTTGVVYGIYNSASVFNLEIYNNTVSNITKTGTGDAFGINQTGVVVNNAKIFQNTISGITVGSTTAEVNGIQVDGGVNTVYNNFISGLTTTSATGENAVRGIAVNTGTNVALYYNTIYLNASSTSTTTFGTSGIYAVTTPNLDMRNNIVVNVSTPGATGGVTAAYRRSTAVLATYNLASNNNLFYAGTPGATRVIYTDGTNTDQTLTAYKNRVAPRELLSVTELPPFINVTTAPFNLHINPAVATQVESAGTPVSVTTDFDGNTRNATTPDLGADEGTFTPLKLLGPSVFYTALNNTVSTANRTITATITDRTGVATAALAPRIYYSKNGGTYFSQPGTAGANNTWTFTILASDLGTLAANDVISYYIVAQDIQATPVVSSFPVGVVATNVNTITTAPAIVSSYKITAAFGASINVGTGQTYTSLTNAGGLFEALNNGALTGNLAVNITSDISGETGLHALNPFTEEGVGNYTITIQPSAAVNRTISGSNDDGLFRLNGTDRLVIDGRFGGSGRYLTFTNNSTATASTATIQLYSSVNDLGVFNGATNNTIRNAKIVGSSNSMTSAFGIYVGSLAISTSGTGAGNNSLIITDNEFNRAYYAIYVSGLSTSPLTGISITNNTIGSATAADYVTYRGVDMQHVTAPVISGNNIFNLILTTGVQNAGIDLGSNITNAMVTRNTISGVRTSNTSLPGSYGINISSATGTDNITIANNMISDIVASNYSATSTTYNSFGIRIVGGTNHKLYYNSVNMTGTPTTGTTAHLSAALMITNDAATGLDIRNNIFSNTMTGLAAAKSYAIYAVTGTTFGTINHNDYYVGGANGILGFLGADKTTLADWKTATTQDVNSISADPLFTSATNLHISASNTALNNAGTPIASVTTDFDGDTRSATTPEIGADEIATAVAAPTVTAGGPTTFCTGGSVVLTAASTAPGATFTWALNGVAIPGATSATYTATTAGSYTAVASPGGASTPIVVTVNTPAATPTITAGGSTTICAGSSVVLTAASTTTGATFQWFNNATAITGATSATFTANAAGSYTVVATAGGCPSAASTATAVTVTPLPATPTITQAGGTLTSSSATGNQWFLNGVAIAGATGQTHVTTANGAYTVVVTANGCASAISAVRNVTNTGINDALAGMSVDVYPNPATGSFNVKLNGYQKDATLVLYNLAGQQITVEKASADGKAKNINLKGLAAGTYLLKVTSDNGVQVNRLIVQ